MPRHPAAVFLDRRRVNKYGVEEEKVPKPKEPIEPKEPKRPLIRRIKAAYGETQDDLVRATHHYCKAKWPHLEELFDTLHDDHFSKSPRLSEFISFGR